MPFLAQCSYCGHKKRVADELLGQSGQCSKCGSYFTMVPIEEALILGPAPGQVGLKQAAPAPQTPATAVAPDQPEPTSAPVPSIPLQVSPTKLAWIEPVGGSALVLGAAGLMCALNYSLSFGVVPLSLAGLLLGIGGLLRALVLDKFRLVIPALAPVVCAGILVTALYFPSMLGPTYLAARARIQIDTSTIRAIPLVGKPDAEPPRGEWVDASLWALQQGRLRVQVMSVTIGPLEAKPVPKKKKPPEAFLFLRLRSRQMLDANDPLGQDVSGAEAQIEPRDDKFGPKLTDAGGKVYTLRSAKIVTPEEKGRRTFPMALADRVFAFEPPGPDTQGLRLEVPAPSGDGRQFRFTIPPAMIQRDQPSPLPAPGGLKGLAGSR